MKASLPGITHWRHDLGHCLHATAGVLLGFHGADPLDLLGAAWGFDYPAGDMRREEYYFPCRDRSLFASLAPHHNVESTWHTPSSPEQGWEDVRARLLAGTPVAVAADNYFLPFRPAYQDVHTNHLLVVHGFDEDRGTVSVCDPVPPRFLGEIRIEELTAARDSANPVRHSRDMFFTANPIGNRWLDVTVSGHTGPASRERLREIVAANVSGWEGAADGSSDYRGLPGLERFLREAATRLADGDPSVVDEVFVVAGVALAVTGLHGDYLAAAARRLGEPPLLKLAREVERIAHHWSAVRIIVATGRDDPATAGRTLAVRTTALLADQLTTVDRMTAVAASI
ncbi:BtrH N-terminal domain-containing protein [Nocardia sp. NRRL S-836]|uniref:BtrH N-terminal domain-containing protein n=1 Tax=Nocardia sp. NRRL S-836 TaxID=1519492 RepID=UPI0006AF5184|nr:BtrH N-terminal domain-containing protein [Nocardia sp. NRRL S-836]